MWFVDVVICLLLQIRPLRLPLGTHFSVSLDFTTAVATGLFGGQRTAGQKRLHFCSFGVCSFSELHCIVGNFEPAPLARGWLELPCHLTSAKGSRGKPEAVIRLRWGEGSAQVTGSFHV